jgi:hypothetical protein
MPAVIFFACLDLEQKTSVMDGRYLLSSSDIFKINRIKFFQKFKEETPLFEKAKPVGLATPATAISSGIRLGRSPWWTETFAKRPFLLNFCVRLKF